MCHTHQQQPQLPRARAAFGLQLLAAAGVVRAQLIRVAAVSEGLIRFPFCRLVPASCDSLMTWFSYGRCSSKPDELPRVNMDAFSEIDRRLSFLGEVRTDKLTRRFLGFDGSALVDVIHSLSSNVHCKRRWSLLDWYAFQACSAQNGVSVIMCCLQL